MRQSKQILKKDIKVLEQLQIKKFLSKKELNLVLSLVLRYKDIYPKGSKVHDKISMILSKHKSYQIRYIKRDRRQYYSMTLNSYFRINDYSVFYFLNKPFFKNFRGLVNHIDNILLLQKLYYRYSFSILNQIGILRRLFELSYSFNLCYGYFKQLDINEVASCELLKLIESLSKMKNNEAEAMQFFNEYKKLVLEKSTTENINKKYQEIHIFKSHQSILKYFEFESINNIKKGNIWKREAR